MNLSNRIEAFHQLGEFLRCFNSDAEFTQITDCQQKYYPIFENQIKQSVHFNAWFTEENVRFAIQTWAEILTYENLIKWSNAYDFTDKEPKTVGIVTAGNLPLVGMHDFISVLISGHKIQIKMSSNDQKLLPVLADFLMCVQPEFKNYIQFTDSKLFDFDAVIATGSNNTARYFETYFGKYPHIIRRNRNAIAVLNGSESEQQLENLGEDIFRYFGLGCRSVSKIFVPQNYSFDLLLKALFKQQEIVDHNKYKNNYDYNKAVYLMSGISLLENGFVLFKEDATYASPIAVIFYEYYDDLNILKTRLSIEKEQIQCIVSNQIIEDTVDFGQTQIPQLWDYADGVDTLEFLLKL